MPFNPITGLFSRAWKFVDRFQAGQDILRTDLDLALDDMAGAVRSLAAGSLSIINLVGEYVPPAAFPFSRPDGSGVKRLDAWIVTAPGTAQGVQFATGDLLVALVANPPLTYTGYWLRVPKNTDIQLFMQAAIDAATAAQDDAATVQAVASSLKATNYSTYVGDGVTTSFALPFLPPSKQAVSVQIGGTPILQADFTLNGSNVDLGTAPLLGQRIQVGTTLIVPAAPANIATLTFASRATFLAWTVANTPPLVGTVAEAGGFFYSYASLAVAGIADLPGWVPLGRPFANHFGANNDNSQDCSPAIQAGIDWLAAKGNGGTLYFIPVPEGSNAIYAMGSPVILKAKVSIDATGARLRAKVNMAAMIDSALGTTITGTSIMGGFWDAQLADRVFRFKQFQNIVVGGGNMELYGALRTSTTIGDVSITSGNYGFYMADLRVSRPNSAYDVSAVAAIESQGFSDSNLSRLLLMGYPKGFTGLAYITRFAMIHSWTYPLTQGQLLTGIDCSGGQNVYSQCQVDTPYSAAYTVSGDDNYRFIGCTATFGDGTQPGPTDNTVPLFSIGLAAHVDIVACFGNDRADRRFSDLATGTLTNVQWDQNSRLRYGTMSAPTKQTVQQQGPVLTAATPTYSAYGFAGNGYGFTAAGLPAISYSGAEWGRLDTNGNLLAGGTANTLGTSGGKVQVQGTGGAGLSANMSLMRFSADTTGPTLYLAKARGAAVGTYTIAAAADTLGTIEWRGADGATTVRSASIAAVVEGTPAAGDERAGIRFFTGNGAGTVAEVIRADINQNVGIGQVTPTTRLDVNGPIRSRGTTVASLPSAATVGNGTRAFVTDATSATFAAAVVGGGSNKVPVYSDGTGWFVG